MNLSRTPHCHSACEKSYRCGAHVPLKCLTCCRDTVGVMLGGRPLLGGLLQVSSICGLNEAQTALLPKCRLISLSFSRVAFWKLQDWPGVASEIKAFPLRNEIFRLSLSKHTKCGQYVKQKTMIMIREWANTSVTARHMVESKDWVSPGWLLCWCPSAGWW